MKVFIRWFDGFTKEIEASKYQCGNNNYWVKSVEGNEFWFPKNEIRYFEVK